MSEFLIGYWVLEMAFTHLGGSSLWQVSEVLNVAVNSYLTVLF